MQFFKFIQAIRPINLLMTVIIMFAVRYGILDIAFQPPFQTLIGFSIYVVSVLCVMAFGYLINDLYDVKTDIINKPGKNIFEEKKSAFATSALIWLPVIAIVIPFCFSLIGWTRSPILLNSLACVFLFVYAQKAKSTVLWGNILIAFLSALLIFSAFAACLNEIKISSEIFNQVMLFSTFSFVTTLVREIVKDAEDVEGDKTAGIKTLATQKGTQLSIKLGITGMTLLMLILSISGFILFQLKPILSIAFGLLVITGFFIIFKLMKSQTKNDFKQISTWLKILMTMGIITMFL